MRGARFALLLLLVVAACGSAAVSPAGSRVPTDPTGSAAGQPAAAGLQATPATPPAVATTAPPTPAPIAAPASQSVAPVPSPAGSVPNQPGVAFSGAPGTPSPLPARPGAPAVGASGSNGLQIGTSGGLYVLDPARGEPSVQGYVIVFQRAGGSHSVSTMANLSVTLNGIRLLRDPNLNGMYWRLDPAGPQPRVGSGGLLEIAAFATLAGKPVQRRLVLPCPADIAVSSAPDAGSAIAPGASLHLRSAANITLNPGVPVMASILPAATLYGYNPATRALVPAGSPKLIGPGPLDVRMSVPQTPAGGYLLDLRWPGHWVPDGETGGFCGLVKRSTYQR